MAAQDTPDAAERRARALLDGHSLARDAAPGLARDVLSLADALRAAQAQRDTADARHAALAGAVRAEREARDAREAALRSERVARVADASADMAGWQVAHDRYTSARVAHERASTHLTALLRGAPGGYVPARVVREYLRARDAHAMPRPEATTAALRDDVIAARTALAAALLAATTTPEESL